MVSYYGTWQFKDLIQTYDLPDKKKTLLSEPCYPDSTVMGHLTLPEYSIFKYIAQVANLDVKMAQSQYMSTLFLCDDKTLLEQYEESFFMNLDRNAALSILNFCTLPRIMTQSSLASLIMAKLDTRNAKNQINFLKKNGKMILNGSIEVVGEIGCTNGVIQKVNGLLIPPDFQM